MNYKTLDVPSGDGKRHMKVLILENKLGNFKELL
jgi:hypothetical protein